MAIAPATAARWYFATQAVAGALWWIAVAASPDVRRLTLGEWPVVPWAVADLVLFVGVSAWAAATGARWAAWTVVAWSAIVTGALAVYATVWRTHGWGAAGMFVASVGTVVAAALLQAGRLPTAWFFIGPFRFRPDRERSVGGHVGRGLTQLVVFWTSFLIALPLALRWIEMRWRLDAPALTDALIGAAGATLFGAASAVGLLSCLTMAIRGRGTPLPAATATRLVVSGPYRWVRNPMAVAGALQTIGVAGLLGSWTVAVAAVVGAFVWHIAIRPSEEADLQHRFGDPYTRYHSAVRCWWPRARPFTAPG